MASAWQWPSLDELRRRTSQKWRTYPPDVLPLWVAEMDVELAEPIVAALHDALARSDTGYPFGTAYAEAVAAFAAERWCWAPDIARTAIVPDVMNGVVEVLKLVTGPGDVVVVNPPVYPPFFSFLRNLDRLVLEAPLGPDLRLDLAALEGAYERAVAGSHRAAHLLCNPQNPTGTVHSADELQAVAALARRHGVRVLVDEIHAPLVLPGTRHVPYLSVPGTEDAFALISATKGWNLPGIKAGLAMAGEGAAAELARMPADVVDGASHLGVISHVAALRDGGPWLDALLAELDTNHGRLRELLAARLPEVTAHRPEATFLAWLDCRALALGDDPAAHFLEHGRVAVVPGPTFGSGGAGHVRLNVATSPEILDEAVRRMASAV